MNSKIQLTQITRRRNKNNYTCQSQHASQICLNVVARFQLHVQHETLLQARLSSIPLLSLLLLACGVSRVVEYCLNVNLIKNTKIKYLPFSDIVANLEICPKKTLRKKRAVISGC